jgi:PAS domain S-box-containing protein
MTQAQVPPSGNTEFPSAEALLSAIIENTDDGIISKNLSGIVTSWNRGAERIFGHESSYMIGRSIMEIIPPERQGEELEILAKLKRGERVDHFETKRLRKDGSLVDVSLTISPIRNANNVIVGASKIARDITLQRRVTELARSAAQEAERQGRMKDEFLATLSHELRTPLQSIVGWIQILQSGDVQPGELEQGLEVIRRNADSQSRIIEDLLDMSRILSGKVRLDVQRVNLAAVIEGTLETVKPAAFAKEIRLQSILDPLAKPVAGDPNRLQQIFWNLLSNAIKFTPRGGRVQILLERVNSHLEVTVTDTGPGISSEFLPFVFERFRQADASTTRSQGGLGLGLAIVKHLVELHGGSVRVKSGGLTSGATFSCIFPISALRADPEGPAPHPQSQPSATTIEPPRLDGVAVLVVDDEEDARTLLAKILTKAGCSVRTAKNATSALELFKQQAPDVLVSDIGMPEEDGYGLIRAVRKLPAGQGGQTPAIALTAYTRMEDRVRAVAEGFQLHIAKPAEALELLTMVQSLAGRK